MNNITIEFCAEDRTRLDAIIAGLQAFGTPFPAPAVAPAAEPNPQPVVAEPDKEQPTAPPVTRADVRNAVVKLSAEGKKDEVRQIVKAYANSVTDLPEDKLHEVMFKLTALGDAL